LSPSRTEGNTRFYDDNDLRRLLNIVGLSQKGMKISQVCALSETEIDALLHLEMEDTEAEEHHFEYYISQLLGYGLSYDGYHFDHLISKCIAEYGMVESYKSVIYPLLVRLGLMWRRDHICPAQEHFLSSIIRQKLFAAINNVPLTKDSGSAWLLFLPEDEDHDIGLLFANYLLRVAGQRVIYLGSKVPLSSLQDTMNDVDATHLLTFMVRNRPLPAAEAYLKELGTLYPHKMLLIAGNGKLLSGISLPPNMEWLQSIHDFERTIKKGRNVN